MLAAARSCLTRGERLSALCAAHEPALRTDADQRVRAHVGACRAASARSISARAFPISAGPTRSSMRPREAVDGGLQPICAVARAAAAARGRRRRITAAISASSSTPSHICVTSGATEALGAAILATVSPGDEVIIFTPAYDSYAPMIRRAGGVAREVALKPPDGGSTAPRSRRAVTAKTRAIMFNNPHNPAGRLFDARRAGGRRGGRSRARPHRHQRRGVGAYRARRPAVHAAGDASRHGGADDQDRLGGQDFLADRVESRLDGRARRSWRSVAARAHQFLTFCTAPNLQAAVAFGLDEGDAWIEPMRDALRRAPATA